MNSNISKAELKRIKQNLPNIKKLIEGDEALIESGTYKKVFVSVFDQWLSNEEANKQIFIDEELVELNCRRQKFKDYIEAINSKTEIFSWRYKRQYRLHIQKPKSVKDVLRKCDFDNLWSQSGQRYSFLIPEYSAIYAEEWDWTNIIWYTERKKIEPILEAAKKVGLHILK